jgi:RNA polymerase sigma-70 factor (ECF subfamily)
MLRRRRHVSLEDIDEPEDPAKGPLDALRKDSQRQLVQQCLLFLPDRQRAAIILSYFEDMRDQEIADVMGVSVGAVESLLVRGRKALRDHMQHLGLRWGEDF